MQPAGLVDAVQRAHFPLAVRDLPDQRAVAAVVVEVLEAGALAEPQEAAVLQPRSGSRVVRPTPWSFRGTASRRGAAVGVARCSGRARSARDSAPGRRPACCRASSRRRRSGSRRRCTCRVSTHCAAEPPALTTPSFTRRIRIAGLRIRRVFDVLADTGCDRRRRSSAPAARRAAGRRCATSRDSTSTREVAAAVDLFLVDPVELAVEDARRCRRS